MEIQTMNQLGSVPIIKDVKPINFLFHSKEVRLSGNDQISFLLPNHKSQQPLFKPAFVGKGAYLTIEVERVDEVHDKMIKMNIPIAVSLRDEPWGDRHFAIVDPNGIGIDIVTYNPQTK